MGPSFPSIAMPLTQLPHRTCHHSLVVTGSEVWWSSGGGQLGARWWFPLLRPVVAVENPEEHGGWEGCGQAGHPSPSAASL